MRSRLPIRHRWALWTGLILLVGGIVASVLFFGSEDNIDASLDHMLPQWLMLLYGCLVAPCLEECAFRLWALDKGWLTPLSLLLAAGYVGLAMHRWWLGLIVLAVLLCCRYVLPATRWREVLLMILTSALFASCHYGNHIEVNPNALLVMLSHFGFGLVGCYLVINHGFFWSLLLHVANNSIAFLAITVITHTWQIGLGTVRYSLSIERGRELSFEQRGDTLVRCQSMASFAYDLAERQLCADGTRDSQLLLYYDIERSWKSDYYIFTVVDNQPSEKSDYWPLLHELAGTNLLRIDTLYRPALCLQLVDTAQMLLHRPDSTVEPEFQVNIEYLEQTCRSRFGMPVRVVHSFDDPLIISNFFDVGPVAYTSHPDSTAFCRWLDEHGLQLLPSEGDTMRIVRFR